MALFMELTSPAFNHTLEEAPSHYSIYSRPPPVLSRFAVDQNTD